MLYQEDVSHILPIYFRNPATFAFWIEFCEEISDDARRQCFKCLVEAILLGIERAFPIHDPTHIAWSMWS